MKHIQGTDHSAKEHSEDVNRDNKISFSEPIFDKSDEMRLKVFIADDSKEIRNRLKEMLKENKSIYLMGESEDAGQAITALRNLKPDVVILDIHMPGGGGMRVLKDIKMMDTDTIAIVFTAFPYVQYRQAYLTAGADYFFNKTQDVQNMVDTLDELARKHLEVEIMMKNEVSTVNTLAVLIIEDSESDAQLIVRLLKKAGYDIAFEQVETAAQMHAALEKRSWDIVISDHSLPQFDSLTALRLLQKTGLDIPFIAVSGTMSEETAVTMMKAGAHDYLNKENLTRLIPAIERELVQAKVRQDRKRAEAALAQSEQAHRTLFENVPVGLYRTSADGRILDVNPAMVKMFGYEKRETLLAANIVDLYVDHTVDERFKAEVKKSDNISDFESEYRRQDGTIFWAREHIHVVRNENGTPLFYEGSLIDITGPKRTEEEIRQRLSELEVLYQSGIALSQLVNPKVIAQNIIDLLDQKMDWHHTTIRLYHPENETLELLAFNHPNLNSEEERRAVEERFRTIIVKKGQGLSGWVIQYHQVVRTGDLKNDLRYVETFPGLQSGLYVPIKIAERVIGVISIESERANAFSKSDERLTITLAAQAAIAINNAQLFDDLQRSNTGLTLAYDATIEGWSRAMDLRDKETEGHTLRVTDLTLTLARTMHISESQLTNIRRGALLHDIGKMGVPDSILLKPGKLTSEEWKIMRRHPIYAYEMLTPIAYLKTALDIPYCHHEKWDGTGYPRGLKAEQIPLVARIFAIVDVWDALTSDRPYRPAWTKEKSLQYIREESGKHFDPQVVEIFLRLIADKGLDHS